MTEIWQEYLLRHGLPIIRPFEPFYEVLPQIYVRENPPIEQRVWAFFLSENHSLIANYSHELDISSQQWYHAIITPPPPAPMPQFSEQMTIIFRNMPFLEELWILWQNNNITSSVSSLRNVPIVRRG